MSTTLHRIPAPQHLWDTFRRAGADHLLAKLTYERVCLVYAADPNTEFSVREGRSAELGRLCDAIKAARNAEQAAMTALAEAQRDHLMGS